RTTREVFDYEPLEAVALKGTSDPAALWCPLAARARFGTDLTRDHSAPLVGRELERTLLQGSFDRAVRDTTPQLVTIVGEPGVGKSRLVAELSAHIDAQPY